MRTQVNHTDVAGLVCAQAERTPDRVAVESGEEHLSYGALVGRAGRVGNYLWTCGVGAEVRVGVRLGRRPALIEALLGVWSAGGTYVPFELEEPASRLAEMVVGAEVRVVLSEGPSGLEEGECGALWLEWKQVSEALAEQPESWPERLVAGELGAYVLHTSGSTGRPKGAVITQAGLLNYLGWAGQAYALGGEGGSAVCGSVSVDLPVTGLWGPLLAGERVVLYPDVTALGRALEEGRFFSVLKLTPTQAGVLGEGWSGRVREVVLGGEALEGDQVLRWRKEAAGLRVFNEYGPTETVVGCCVYAVPEGEVRSGGVAIGGAITNTRLYVLDEDLEPVGSGGEGQLYIAGEGVCRGYAGDPARTAEQFVPERWGPAGSRMYASGDWVRYGSGGELEYLGRRDEQVKIRGYRVELGEVESALRRHPGVLGAAVAVGEVRGGRRLQAYVVLREGEELGGVREAVQGWLPGWLQPSSWVPVKELPMGRSGKVDRQALLRLSGGPARETPVPPRTPAEERLAAIWAEVLGVPQVGIHDNFFELGGDSILAIQVVAKALQSGLEITVGQVFDCPTVAELAAVAGTGLAVVAEQGLVEGPVTLTAIQRWFFEQDLAEPEHWNQAVLLRSRGRLEARWLRGALGAVLRQHDALRLRFVRGEGGWQAFNAREEKQEVLTEVDLEGVPAERREALRARVYEQAQGSLSLGRGPMLRVLWVREEEGGRLLWVVHHLVVDGVSWRMLLEDLERGYEQLSRGEEVRLGAKTTSWQEWGWRLEERALDGSAVDGSYWEEVSRREGVRLPCAVGPEKDLEGDSATVSVALSEMETEGLKRSAGAGGSGPTLEELLLAGVARSLSAWLDSEGVLVELEGHGREWEGPVDVSRTVGWFTTLYPMWLEVGWGAGLGELVSSVKAQVRGVPRRGASYGWWRHLGPGRGPVVEPEVSVNYLGQLDGVVGQSRLWEAGGEASGRARGRRNRRPRRLAVSARVAGGRLRLDWTHGRLSLPREVVAGLAADCLRALRALATEPLSPSRPTPAEFPLAGLDQARLDDLLGRVQFH
jgi:amino acid adenylation domain-containing protein/non-ribosomal peptide synthase protein (TIGR01720 family)